VSVRATREYVAGGQMRGICMCDIVCVWCVVRWEVFVCMRECVAGGQMRGTKLCASGVRVCDR